MAYGIGPAMFLIMFTLKLAGPMKDVSWWWVTCPLWGAFIVFFLYFVGLVAYHGLKAQRDGRH